MTILIQTFIFGCNVLFVDKYNEEDTDEQEYYDVKTMQEFEVICATIKRAIEDGEPWVWSDKLDVLIEGFGTKRVVQVYFINSNMELENYAITELVKDTYDPTDIESVRMYLDACATVPMYPGLLGSWFRRLSF